MTNSRDQLLRDIEAFIERTGMSSTRFSIEAAGDRAFLLRFRAGRDVTLSMADRLRRYMAEYQPPRRQARMSRATPCHGAAA